MLNGLAWAFSAVPGYGLSRADAKKKLSYFLVEFQEMASKSDSVEVPFLGMTDKIRLLLTASPRSGYLRPLFSMIATSLAMLDDRQRARCYQLLRSFVTDLVNEIEISVSDLQTIVADLARNSRMLSFRDSVIVVPDDETVNVVQSAINSVSQFQASRRTCAIVADIPRCASADLLPA